MNTLSLWTFIAAIWAALMGTFVVIAIAIETWEMRERPRRR